MTIGIGFIGASRIARDAMIPVFAAHPDCELVSVYSSNPERGQEYAAANGIKRAAASVAELVNDPGVHAVYISTTNELHHAQVLAAAKAGKHVLCEKPIAMSVTEGNEMVAACHEAGVVMATNHHLRNAAPIRKLQELVANGAIGQPLAARVFHAVYLRESLQGWRINNPAAGGGVVMDIVVHDIDTLRFILGTEPTEVVSMSQSAGMAEGVEDGNMAVFRFNDGLLAQVHTAFTVKYAGDGIELHGTEGSLRVTGVLGRSAGSAITLTNAEGEQQITVEHHSLDAETVRLFVAAVQGNGQPAANGEDGVISMAAALACLQAAGKRGITIKT
jgi:1,5-anhydro-D-fructose reductase (1,5-anhydro-D-mannitol-forming)